MTHKGFIDINQSINIVAELFANSDNLKEYQDGFIRKELVSGNKGEVNLNELNEGLYTVEVTTTMNKIYRSTVVLQH